jgi:hypothetical protein
VIDFTIFDEHKWNYLPNNLKLLVAIRLFEGDAYFSGLKKSTGLESGPLHTAIDNMIDLGSINARWEKIKGEKYDKWVRLFFLQDTDYIDSLIEMMRIRPETI